MNNAERYKNEIAEVKGKFGMSDKVVKSNKAANRDFFILAAAYVATLVLMIYLFIR